MLPFADSSFDAVIASDMLEHLPSAGRGSAVAEALRVARRVAIFGFPCGAAARLLDERLFADFRKMGTEPPEWLQEHMEFPFPDSLLFEVLPAGWEVEKFGNEHVRFHDWMNRRERNRLWDLAFRLCLKLFPAIVEIALRLADRAPYYRMIFVVSRSTGELSGKDA